MSAPVDLDTIKDDLDIPASDTTNDEWLQRRIDGIWSRIESYTGRKLTTASGWADDWGELVTNQPKQARPYQPASRGSVFLRVFPVISITRLTVNGSDQNAAGAVFDPESGRLLSLAGLPSIDMSGLLLSSAARIEYSAGFAELPAVLYEALLGALAIQWSTRAALASGAGVNGFLPRRISAIDVGDVELSMAPNAIVEATMKGGGTGDPLLGTYTELLEPFVDYRSMVAGALPTTQALS